MLGEISQTPRKDSMGADMVPVYEGEQDTAAIKIDPVTTQNIGLRTARIGVGPVHRLIRTVGRVEFDETAVSEVTTRVPGWIEKLHVDSTGQLVHKGEPLFEFYSPELYLGEKEYLLALDDGPQAATFAINKLYHLGLPVGLIENLKRTKTVPHTLMIDSPRDGVCRGEERAPRDDGRARKSALSDWRSRQGVGAGGNLRTGFAVHCGRTGSDREAALHGRPSVSRGKSPTCIPRSMRKTRTAASAWYFPTPAFS